MTIRAKLITPEMIEQAKEVVAINDTTTKSVHPIPTGMILGGVEVGEGDQPATSATYPHTQGAHIQWRDLHARSEHSQVDQEFPRQPSRKNPKIDQFDVSTSGKHTVTVTVNPKPVRSLQPYFIQVGTDFVQADGSLGAEPVRLTRIQSFVLTSVGTYDIQYVSETTSSSSKVTVEAIVVPIPITDVTIDVPEMVETQTTTIPYAVVPADNTDTLIVSGLNAVIEGDNIVCTPDEGTTDANLVLSSTLSGVIKTIPVTVNKYVPPAVPITSLTGVFPSTMQVGDTLEVTVTASPADNTDELSCKGVGATIEGDVVTLKPTKVGADRLVISSKLSGELLLQDVDVKPIPVPVETATFDALPTMYAGQDYTLPFTVDPATNDDTVLSTSTIGEVVGNAFVIKAAPVGSHEVTLTSKLSSKVIGQATLVVEKIPEIDVNIPYELFIGQETKLMSRLNVEYSGTGVTDHGDGTATIVMPNVATRCRIQLKELPTVFKEDTINTINVTKVTTATDVQATIRCTPKGSEKYIVHNLADPVVTEGQIVGTIVPPKITSSYGLSTTSIDTIKQFEVDTETTLGGSIHIHPSNDKIGYQVIYGGKSELKHGDYDLVLKEVLGTHKLELTSAGISKEFHPEVLPAATMVVPTLTEGTPQLVDLIIHNDDKPEDLSFVVEPPIAEVELQQANLDVQVGDETSADTAQVLSINPISVGQATLTVKGKTSTLLETPITVEAKEAMFDIDKKSLYAGLNFTFRARCTEAATIDLTGCELVSRSTIVDTETNKNIEEVTVINRMPAGGEIGIKVTEGSRTESVEATILAPKLEVTPESATIDQGQSASFTLNVTPTRLIDSVEVTRGQLNKATGTWVVPADEVAKEGGTGMATATVAISEGNLTKTVSILVK